MEARRRRKKIPGDGGDDWNSGESELGRSRQDQAWETEIATARGSLGRRLLWFGSSEAATSGVWNSDDDDFWAAVVWKVGRWPTSARGRSWEVGGEQQEVRG
ncbi:unnamed protein product [Linum trigynum]|uniref:Uncharacterized protein n=1 Tax=Linum trigynum TaxID=586398 RepID=A0AAV2DWX5_9ROSI